MFIVCQYYASFYQGQQIALKDLKTEERIKTHFLQGNNEHWILNHLIANPTKWSNTLIQFVGNSDKFERVCPSCGLAPKGLTKGFFFNRHVQQFYLIFPTLMFLLLEFKSLIQFYLFYLRLLCFSATRFQRISQKQAQR